ncbi:MAG: hypothetical protein KAS36_12330 [Anaerolineales bacterium]|jgi:hypothetical protein|nr:hypothetical protein [Anaerolineales bacterium]
MAKRWTHAEEATLIENYKIKTIQELMDTFPFKSQDSINAKIKRLKAKDKIDGAKGKDVVKRAYEQRR